MLFPATERRGQRSQKAYDVGLTAVVVVVLAGGGVVAGEGTHVGATVAGTGIWTWYAPRPVRPDGVWSVEATTPFPT
jgi:hypothetical protein